MNITIIVNGKNHSKKHNVSNATNATKKNKTHGMEKNVTIIINGKV